STFAGQRPDGAEPVDWALIVSAELVKDTALLPPYILDFGQVSTVVPILHASTLIAPVPCARTFLATVFSARGLRARTIGSNAGFNAVPQPSHCAASGVAGMSRRSLASGGGPPSMLAVNVPIGFPAPCFPVTRRSASAITGPHRASSISRRSRRAGHQRASGNWYLIQLATAPVRFPSTTSATSNVLVYPFAVIAARSAAPNSRCWDAPGRLSIAFPTSCDFGNPDPYSHARLSRISNPASSIATARRCQVRVPPKAAMCPPGLS